MAAQVCQQIIIDQLAGMYPFYVKDNKIFHGRHYLNGTIECFLNVSLNFVRNYKDSLLEKLIFLVFKY